MLVLPALAPSPVAGSAAYADRDDSHLAWILPAGVSIEHAFNGVPDFTLLRYRNENGTGGGGVLRLRLGWSPAAAQAVADATTRGWRVVPVPLTSGRSRVVRRVVVGGDAQAIGPWTRVTTGGEELAVVRLDLNAQDAQLVADLLAEPTGLVDVDVEATYAVVVPGIPWLVTADRVALHDALASLLGTGTVTRTQILAAFASLPSGTGPLLRATPQQDGAAAPDAVTLAAEVGARAIDILFANAPSSSEPAWTLLPPVATADPVAFDLLVPRQDSATLAASWSMSESWASMDPSVRALAMPAVTAPEPFESVTIPVVCDLPFDSQFLTAVQCDVRTTGADGTAEYRSFHFPEGGNVQRFTAIYPAMTTHLDPAFEVRATVAPPSGTGWPAIVERPYAPLDDPFVDVNRAACGIDFVRVDAEPPAFDLASSLLVTVTGAHAPVTAALSSSRPGSWMALVDTSSSDELTVTIDAVPPSGAASAGAVRIFSQAVSDRQVRIARTDLEPKPEDIVVTLDPAATANFAYVAVTIEPPTGPPVTRTLTPPDDEHVTIRRASIFDSLHYRYQLSLVAYDSGRRTLPLVTDDWVDAAVAHLVLTPTTPAIPTT